MKDWDGMLAPPGVLKCKKCGKTLNEDGGHPAEVYAGTATGLCYGCERAGAFVAEDIDDGCKRTSHPPHCPAWRRDREEYVWSPGCTKQGCNMGAIWVGRSLSMGGSYTKQCESCFYTWLNGPTQKAIREQEKRDIEAFRQSFGTPSLGQFQIMVNDGDGAVARTVSGEKFSIPRFPFTQFAIHSSGRKKWSVTEMISGLRVAFGESKDDALRQIARSLFNKSEHWLMEIVAGV